MNTSVTKLGEWCRMISAKAVNWFHDNFRRPVALATAGTPFRPDLIVAIAMKETGYLVDRLVAAGLPVPDVLERCVGDTKERRKKKVAANRATLEAADHGEQIFRVARHALELVAPYSQGYRKALADPDKFCRGFGIFQYDLQFFLADRAFFLDRKWCDFDECLSRFIKELRQAQHRNRWDTKKQLSVDEEVGLAIAYNAGSYKPERGLKQGHRNKASGEFYGEEVARTLEWIGALQLDWRN